MKTAFALMVLVVAVSVDAEVVQFRKCPNVPNDACRVTELRVTPCSKPAACQIKKGDNYTLSFDYIPNFSSSKLTTAVYSASDPEIIFPAVGEADACLYSTCPAVPGTQSTFTYQLRIGKKLPKGKFGLRWKIWNTENVNEICCMETTVNLK